MKFITSVVSIVSNNIPQCAVTSNPKLANLLTLAETIWDPPWTIVQDAMVEVNEAAAVGSSMYFRQTIWRKRKATDNNAPVIVTVTVLNELMLCSRFIDSRCFE